MRTGLSLPDADAYALATAIRAGERANGEVRLESFNRKVNRAFADLHPAG